MEQPEGHVLASFNFGFLRHDWEDPRVAPFVDALDTVNDIAARSPGFVWRLSDAEMEAEQLNPDGAFGGDPRVASTLSLWRDAESFAAFVLRSLHARFMLRAGAWLEVERSGLVLWWQPKTERPGVSNALARYARLQSEGPGPHGFGWAALGLSPGAYPPAVRRYLSTDIE